MSQRILNRKKDCRCSYEAKLSFLTRREEEILIQIYISIKISKKLDIMHVLLYIKHKKAINKIKMGNTKEFHPAH